MVFASGLSPMTRRTRAARSTTLAFGFPGAASAIAQSLGGRVLVNPDAELAAESQRPSEAADGRGRRLVVVADENDESRLGIDGCSDPDQSDRTGGGFVVAAGRDVFLIVATHVESKFGYSETVRRGWTRRPLGDPRRIVLRRRPTGDQGREGRPL